MRPIVVAIILTVAGIIFFGATIAQSHLQVNINSAFDDIEKINSSVFVGTRANKRYIVDYRGKKYIEDYFDWVGESIGPFLVTVKTTNNGKIYGIYNWRSGFATSGLYDAVYVSGTKVFMHSKETNTYYVFEWLGNISKFELGNGERIAYETITTINGDNNVYETYASRNKIIIEKENGFVDLKEPDGTIRKLRKTLKGVYDYFKKEYVIIP